MTTTATACPECGGSEYGHRMACKRAALLAARDLIARMAEDAGRKPINPADARDALRSAEECLVEAIGWVPTKNLDEEHHHYDPRAVAFVERCEVAVRLVRKARGGA